MDPVTIGLIAASVLGGLFGKSKTKYEPVDPSLTTPKYTSPDQMGVPQYLADGSVNPMWTFLSSGMMPGYTTTSNTGGFSNTKSTSTTNTNTTGKSVTSPEYFHGSQGVLDALVPMMKQRLQTGGKVGTAEQMGVINQIMRDAGSLEGGLVNSLTERGVAGSPVEAGARAALGQGVTQALAGYRTQIPATERARGLENEQQVASLLANLFKGSKTVFDQQTKSKTDSLAETLYGSSTENITPPMFNPAAAGLNITQPTLVPQSNTNIFGKIGDLSSLMMMFQGMGLFGKGTNPLEFAGPPSNIIQSGSSLASGFGGTDYITGVPKSLTSNGLLGTNYWANIFGSENFNPLKFILPNTGLRG